MKNYVIEMMAERNFTVKANTPEEALDFIIHACFNSNIISFSDRGITSAHFSCHSPDNKEEKSCLAVQVDGKLEGVDTNI